MRTTHKLTSLLACALAAATFAAPATAQSSAPIKIGVAGPFTGPMATYGEQVYAGIATYVDTVNAAGGLNGRRITLVKGDDACEPKQAVAVANRFVDQDKVDAVIGHFCSATTLPASNIYDDAGLLMMTYASTAPQVTDRGLDNVFRACGRDDQQAVVAAGFIVDTLKKTKIALIHDKDAYGKGLVDAVRTTLKARGMEPVLYEGLSKGERDFNALVTKIRAVGADAVYFGGLIPEGGPLIRQIHEQGLDIAIISGDSFAQTQLVAAAGGPANLQNVYYSATPDPLSDPDTLTAQNILKAADVPLANYTLYGFAAAQAMVAALADGRVADLEQQIAWLRQNKLTTAIGRIHWDGKGDIANFRFVFFKFDAVGNPVSL